MNRRLALALASTLALSFGASAPCAWSASAPGAASASSPSQVQASTDPQAFVQGVVDRVLGDLRAHPGLSASAAQELVQAKVLPFVDFAAMTRSAAGVYWRRATPAQQAELTAQFEELLVRTYSGALAQASGSKVTVQPVRGIAPATSSVIVRTSVVHDGQRLAIVYRLQREGASWKVVDMNILGVWLVDNYRGVFAEQAGRAGVAGLIQALEQQNQQNDRR